MAKNYYMHTLNGKPAWFDGGIIWNIVSPRRIPFTLVHSLQQIKRERAKSKKNRSMYCDFKYGYLRVCLPPQESTTKE